MQYFKFVTDGTAQSVNEVKDALEDYQHALPNPIPHEAVLLMPMGASRQQQEELQKKVALICMEHGFVFCGRLHVWVFDNAVGT
jgi:7-carboxy-7-deazaguanine synthase